MSVVCTYRARDPVGALLHSDSEVEDAISLLMLLGGRLYDSRIPSALRLPTSDQDVYGHREDVSANERHWQRVHRSTLA